MNQINLLLENQDVQAVDGVTFDRLDLAGSRICLLLQMVPSNMRPCSCCACRASFRCVQIAIKPIERFGLRRAGYHLHLMDVAAFCASQRPVLVPRSRGRDPLHHGRALATVASSIDPVW